MSSDEIPYIVVTNTPGSNMLKFSIFGALANVSAASYQGGQFAPESIVTAYGVNLAAQTVAANMLPLPTTLAGSQVRVRDSQGVERAAPLFFVSPGQINYLMRSDVAPGLATVTVINSNANVSTGQIEITFVAPGLFAANATGQGLAAAYAVRVRADGQQSFEQTAQYDPAQQAFNAMPIDLTVPNEQVVLVLFGTGFRHRSSLNAVTVEVGGLTLTPMFAGATPGLAGLDQLNLRLPIELAGKGMTELLVKVDGQAANVIKASFK